MEGGFFFELLIIKRNFNGRGIREDKFLLVY